MEQAFPGDAAGIAAFESYLGRHTRSAFRLLVNLAEESHRIDDIPPLRGRERQALIERRLSHYFPGTALTNVISLGRRPAGRRDEIMLFSACTRPDEFEPWLTAMRGRQTRLAGIHSTALLTRRLAETLLPPDGPVLLLTFGRSDLRQSVYRDGQFQFSRLTLLSDQAPRTAAALCTTEAGKIRQYLVGQEMLDWQAPLQVTILVPADQVEAFRTHCRDSEELRLNLADLPTAARNAGLDGTLAGTFTGTLADADSTPLFLHLLATKRQRPQFAPRRERRFFRLSRIRCGLRLGQAALAAGVIGFSLSQASAIHDLRRHAELRQRQLQTARQDHAALIESLPPLPIGADALRALIDRHEALANRAPSPGDLYLPLSHVLDRLPQIAPQRIDWLLSDTLEPGTDPLPANATPSFAIVRVEARLPPSLATDHRARTQLLEALKTLVSRDARLGIRILPLPVDPDSGGTLRSDAASAGIPAATALPLTFEISRRLQ
ncbi:hypothetical protein B9N43_07865 [Denitratisoma sp. DHT3]|nr:hypothetical protein B9N43_07865 [Denitratisoma sp. DHT3]